MEEKAKNKYLIKNTFFLFLGNFGSKLISLILVPLYTNILTVKEYGKLDFITVLTTILVPILTLNIQESIMRFSIDKKEEKNKILNIGLIILVISSAIALLLIPLFNCFEITRGLSVIIAVYIISYISSGILICYIRGLEQLLDYSIISVIQTFIIATSNILFLVILKKGILGYLYSYIIAHLVVCVLCIKKGKVISELKEMLWDKKLFLEMLKYSIFLIPNSLMWWVINSSDKVMITQFLGIEVNGLYAISYKIPTIVVTLTTIFNQAWMYSAIKENKISDKNKYTQKIYDSLFVIVLTFSMIILVSLKPILYIFVGKSFLNSWIYTPPLVLGTVFLTMATFLSNEYSAHKDSWGFLKSSTIGAIINILLNILLITKIGALGAAISTCISYIVVFLFRIIDTKKYIQIQCISLRKILDIVLLLVICLLMYWDNVFKYVMLIILISISICNNKDIWVKVCENCLKIIFERKKHK